MDWDKVVSELRRHAKCQEQLVLDPYKHATVRQSAATIAAVLLAMADAFERGKEHSV